MKKSLAVLLALCSLPVFADPVFNNITKKDVENVTEEFGSNFTHTVVAAPETNGAWGIEIGAAGGMANSPEFKKVVDNSGGDGSDFKKIYHAGAIARVHVPFDIFLEASFLPKQKFDNVEAENTTFGAGWNFGGFFNWPVDVAIGMGHGKSKVSFHQDQNISTSTPEADITLETTSTIYYLGVSKTFAFFTPYIKGGVSQLKGDLDATANIFNVGGQTQEKVSLSGTYLAVGANIQLLIFRLGIEASQVHDVGRVSGKFSFAF